MIDIGSQLALQVEKPTAGGRMLARHDGQVVLVWGAIPGERVRARVERVSKGVVYADTLDVLDPSPDRREPGTDWRCGGNVFAHVRYERQLHLKGEIIRDALTRIGRVALASTPDVAGSPERGYRMRARLHAVDGRIGFFREASHQLCDVASTGQFLPETNAWIADLERVLKSEELSGLAGIEIAENIPASERAAHPELHAGINPARFAKLSSSSSVTDVLRPAAGVALRLRRNVRSFFQGNRFLLERLVHDVAACVPPGPVVDLYAGVGLFGLSLAASGTEHVTLVEGDAFSGADLQGNAEPFHDQVEVVRSSVEEFLRSAGLESKTRPTDGVDSPTYIVDPPRTGISKEALTAIIQRQPVRLVYVSCDVATLARDARMLLDGGYDLSGVTGIDLFPNTAHVESIATFVRQP
jgi:23S rRNA (uracil1939-C5)-methyltransferase